jgi:alanine-glyoxylate transaminase/serine-glyoxylate transaminase/serine-pyruvate transaminase
MIAKYVTGAGARAYHHTAPISMIYALHAGLGAVLDEGLDASWERHRACGEALQAGLESLGWELFAEEGHRLPQLTTVWVPLDRLRSGMDEATARRTLLTRYGIEVGGGLGDYAGKVWRIGCMGHTARLRNVTLLLAAIEELMEP